MSWLSGLGSAVGGLLGYASASQNWAAQKEMFDQQMAFNREQFEFQKGLAHWNQDYTKNKYKYSVDDMKNAGLNPMLATGINPQNSGISSANVANPTAPQLPNKASSMMSSAAIVAQIVNAFVDQENKNKVATAQASALDASAEKSNQEVIDLVDKHNSGYWDSSAKANFAKVREVGLYGMQVQQQARESVARISQIESEIQKTHATIQLLRQQAKTEESKRQLMALEGHLNVYTSQLRAAQRDNEFIQKLAGQVQLDQLRLGMPEVLARSKAYRDLLAHPERYISGSPAAHPYFYLEKQYGRPKGFRIGPYGLGWNY